MKKSIYYSFVLLMTLLCAACSTKVPESFNENQNLPVIYPDYCNVTIPPNIAPLHFMIDEKGDHYITRISSPHQEWTGEGQKAMPSLKQWRELTADAKGQSLQVEVYVEEGKQWTKFKTFNLYVAEEDIDPYISYRLISPSYVTYKDLTINQRDLTSYDESVIYGNMMNTSVDKGQCINCHSYQNYNPERMQFHVREGYGGTVIAYDGKLRKVNAKTDSLISSGVYPSWHPTLPLIAYSVNTTGQTFHTLDIQKIEVQDMASDLIIYDVDKNEVTRIKGDDNEMEVFPWWSPKGDCLYYCSAHYERKDTGNITSELIRNYKDVKYNIYRRKVNPQTLQVDSAELVFDAAALQKSATLPRISPDGRYLMFTLGGFGVFHIWHTDADLYLMDLQSGQTRPMTEMNSDNVESYHSWSSNGRWVIFSSRRTDGNFTRPFIAYFDKNGKGRKAFELPQEDPDMHRQFMRSYNIPEFMNGPVNISAQDFADIIKNGKTEPARQRN